MGRLHELHPARRDVDVDALALERELIGDLIRDREAREACSDLDQRDLLSRDHADLLVAIRRLDEAGTPVDISTVGAEAQFPRDRLAQIVDCSITPASARYRADRVRDMAVRRRLAEGAAALALAARTDDDAGELIERGQRMIDDERAVMTKIAESTTAQRALSIGGEARVLTGLKTLDANTRGGLRVRKRIVIGGAPGAGKTTLLVDRGWAWARSGLCVLLLSYDEEAEDALVRIGQINGIERTALEHGDDAARRELSRVLAEVPNFQVIDGEEEEITIAEASAKLAKRRAPGQLSVFCVDSIQTARAPRADGAADSDKMRVDRVMAALKLAGKVDGHLVVATCELSRAGYRSQDARERTDDLAAFKESGGIEYGASMALVLRSVKDQDGLVDVTVPKNRMGKKTPFRLSLNFTTATFREIDLPDPEEAEATNTPLQKLKDRVVDVLSKSIQPVTSIGELSRRLNKGKQAAQKAVKELIEDGRVQKNEDGSYSVLSGSEPVPEPPCGGCGSAVLSPKGEPRTRTAPRTGPDGVVD